MPKAHDSEEYREDIPRRYSLRNSRADCGCLVVELKREKVRYSLWTWHGPPDSVEWSVRLQAQKPRWAGLASSQRRFSIKAKYITSKRYLNLLNNSSRSWMQRRKCLEKSRSIEEPVKFSTPIIISFLFDFFDEICSFVRVHFLGQISVIIRHKVWLIGFNKISIVFIEIGFSVSLAWKCIRVRHRRKLRGKLIVVPAGTNHLIRPEYSRISNDCLTSWKKSSLRAEKEENGYSTPSEVCPSNIVNRQLER